MNVRSAGEAESQFSDVLDRYRMGEATQAELVEALDEKRRWDRIEEINMYRAAMRDERNSQMRLGH